MATRNSSLRALQFELEQLEIEAEQAPLVRQQQQDDQLLLGTGGGGGIASIDDEIDVTYENNRNSFVPASMLITTQHQHQQQHHRRRQPVSSISSSLGDAGSYSSAAEFNIIINNNNNSSSDRNRHSSATSNPTMAKNRVQFEEAMKMQAVANLRRVQISNEFIEYNQASRRFHNDGSTGRTQQPQQRSQQDRDHRTPLPNKRRFGNIDDGGEDDNDDDRDRGENDRAGRGMTFDENVSFASSSSAAAAPGADSSPYRRGTLVGDGAIAAAQRRRFEQVPPSVEIVGCPSQQQQQQQHQQQQQNSRGRELLHGILGVDEDSSTSPVPPAPKLASEHNGNYNRYSSNNNNNNNSNSVVRQHQFVGNPSSFAGSATGHESPATSSAGFSSCAHHQQRRSRSGGASSSNMLNAVPSSNDSQSSPLRLFPHHHHQQQYQHPSSLSYFSASSDDHTSGMTSLSHHGKAQAKRMQMWGKEANFLQSALREIETSNATMTLREYRRTKPRIISTQQQQQDNHQLTHQDAGNSGITTRPVSAPSLLAATNANPRQDKSEVELEHGKTSALAPITPSSSIRRVASGGDGGGGSGGSSNGCYNNVDVQMQVEALRGVLDDSTPEEIFRGPNLSRYNDPVLETKANKRLVELMAREAQERHERALRSLGAEKLEDLLVIDDETIAQQRRARATANAAKRNVILNNAPSQQHVDDEAGDEGPTKRFKIIIGGGSSSSSCQTSSAALVPPRTILASAQENLKSDIRRELALKEHISLSDLAIRMADEAFAQDQRERRKHDEANHASQVERLSVMTRTISSSTSAAEAVLMVKHQAKLQSTRQTIRAELERCKFLVKQLRQQSDRAEGTKKKLQKALAEAVQKIGRGYLVRKELRSLFVNIAGDENVQEEEEEEEPQQGQEQGRSSSAHRHRRSPHKAPHDAHNQCRELLDEAGPLPSPLSASPSGSKKIPTVTVSATVVVTCPVPEVDSVSNRSRSSPINDDEEGKEGDAAKTTHLQQGDIDSGGSSPLLQQHDHRHHLLHLHPSPLRSILEEARRDLLACADGNAVPDREAVTCGIFSQPLQHDNSGIVHDSSSSILLPSVHRQGTCIFRNAKNVSASAPPVQPLSGDVNDSFGEMINLLHQQHQQQLEDEERKLKTEQELKELLSQRQHLQKLVFESESTAESTSAVIDSQQQEQSTARQYSLDESRNHPLIFFMNNNGASTHSGATSLTTSVSQHHPPSDINRRVEPSQQYSVPKSLEREDGAESASVENHFLESLVATQDRIIQLLTERQAASVKTLRLLQEGKLTSRQSIRAATVIQSVARMFLARCRFIRMIEERDCVDLSHQAALMIQRVWRGSQARIIYRRRQRLRERHISASVRHTSNTSNNGKRLFPPFKSAAATAIQSIWFCFVARRILHRLRFARSERDSLQVLNDASRVLSSFMRRVVNKKTFQGKLITRRLEHLSTCEAIVQRQKQIEDDFAARLIGRMWRVHAQMKKYQRQRSMKLLNQSTIRLVRKRSSSLRSSNSSPCGSPHSLSAKSSPNNATSFAPNFASLELPPFNQAMASTTTTTAATGTRKFSSTSPFPSQAFSGTAQQDESLSEQEYAVRKIQLTWISKATARATRIVLGKNSRRLHGKNDEQTTTLDLPIGFLGSVPRRNLSLIGRLMELKKEQLDRQQLTAVVLRQEQEQEQQKQESVKKNDERGECGDVDEDENSRTASDFVRFVLQSAVLEYEATLNCGKRC